MKRLGLWKPTKFTIANATHIPLTENNFVPCPRAGKNIIGKLTENELNLLHRAAAAASPDLERDQRQSSALSRSTAPGDNR